MTYNVFGVMLNPAQSNHDILKKNSVFLHCWLGIRKCLACKNWVMRC